jgi:hypothetical protein
MKEVLSNLYTHFPGSSELRASASSFTTHFSDRMIVPMARGFTDPKSIHLASKEKKNTSK